MPTYQYRCTACDQPLEVVQSFSDAALTECPACGGPLRKVYGAVGVVFKGSGFYKNDSRSEKKSGAPAASSSSDTTTTPAKTDSPAAAPAAAPASTPAASPSKPA